MHTNMDPHTYTFSSFDYVDDFVYIPGNSIFYRGVPEGSQVVRDIPIYLASEDVARRYAGRVAKVHIPHRLKLIDLRKMKNYMRLVISSRKGKSKTTDLVVFYLTIAYGLCSFKAQRELIKAYIDQNMDPFANKEDVKRSLDGIKNMTDASIRGSSLKPVEPEGVRIADTYIDGRLVIILKDLLKGVCDGYIAPRMFSPFHFYDRNVMHEEIVVFDPVKHGLKETQEDPIVYDLTTLLSHTNDVISMQSESFCRRIHMKRGGGKDPLPDRNRFFDDGRNIENARKLSKAFLKSVTFDFKKVRFLPMCGDV